MNVRNKCLKGELHHGSEQGFERRKRIAGTTQEKYYRDS